MFKFTLILTRRVIQGSHIPFVFSNDTTCIHQCVYLCMYTLYIHRHKHTHITVTLTQCPINARSFNKKLLNFNSLSELRYHQEHQISITINVDQTSTFQLTTIESQRIVTFCQIFIKMFHLILGNPMLSLFKVFSFFLLTKAHLQWFLLIKQTIVFFEFPLDLHIL